MKLLICYFLRVLWSTYACTIPGWMHSKCFGTSIHGVIGRSCLSSNQTTQQPLYVGQLKWMPRRGGWFDNPCLDSCIHSSNLQSWYVHWNHKSEEAHHCIARQQCSAVLWCNQVSQTLNQSKGSYCMHWCIHLRYLSSTQAGLIAYKTLVWVWLPRDSMDDEQSQDHVSIAV